MISFGSARLRRVAVGTSLVLSLAAATASAQMTAADPGTANAKPTPRGPDGKPDFSGYWKGSRDTKPGGNIGKDLPGFKLPLTPDGEARLQYNLTKTKDPESLCIIGGTPRHHASGLPFQIVQHARHIVFLYWYSYYRLTPIGDDLKHSEDPDPAYFGESIAKWEGDTLVVDSVAHKGDNVWIDENANPVSDAVHLVERWTRPDQAHLTLEATITDPKYYTRPFTYSRTWIAGADTDQLREYSCSENNKFSSELGYGPGPIRPDGTRGYDAPAPLPPPLPRKTAPK
jgi:hypothetical protein